MRAMILTPLTVGIPIQIFVENHDMYYVIIKI